MNFRPRFRHSGLPCLVFLLSTLCGCANHSDFTFDPVTQDIAEIDEDYPPDFSELFIPSHGDSLSGFLLGANGAGPHPTVLLLHGFPGNEKNLDLAQSIRRAGFNVLFFHYRGAWGSEGAYALTHLAEDVASASKFLRENATSLRIDTNRLSFVGHSMGGFAALRAAARDDNVICVAGISAVNLGEYANSTEAQAMGFKTYTDSLFMLNHFDGDMALQEIQAHAKEFDVRNDGPGLKGKSVLLVAGAQDTTVPPGVQDRIAQAYRAVEELKLITAVIEGDHAFSASRIALQRHVLDWLQSDCQ